MTQRPAKREIEFDLLSVAPLGEEAVAKDYKQAILAVAHAVELLLKERLQREHPALIWRNVETRRYWYVDHLHYGQASHLEVFDARGLHVGESNLEGTVDASKLDREKTIDL